MESSSSSSSSLTEDSLALFFGRGEEVARGERAGVVFVFAVATGFFTETLDIFFGTWKDKEV